MSPASPVVYSREVRGVPVVEINGELDLHNVHELEAALQAAAERDAGVVIVSFAGVRYFDSSVVHKVLAFRQQLSVNRQTFLAVQPSLEAAQRLLSITGLAQKQQLCASVEEAVAAATTLIATRVRKPG